MGELLALGCRPRRAKSICFAMGQRVAMLPSGADMWGPARAALENYKQGTWDVPGRKLATQLTKEAFGDPPDQQRVLRWLRERLLSEL